MTSARPPRAETRQIATIRQLGKVPKGFHLFGQIIANPRSVSFHRGDRHEHRSSARPAWGGARCLRACRGHDRPPGRRSSHALARSSDAGPHMGAFRRGDRARRRHRRLDRSRSTLIIRLPTIVPTSPSRPPRFSAAIWRRRGSLSGRALQSFRWPLRPMLLGARNGQRSSGGSRRRWVTPCPRSIGERRWRKQAWQIEHLNGDRHRPTCGKSRSGLQGEADDRTHRS